MLVEVQCKLRLGTSASPEGTGQFAQIKSKNQNKRTSYTDREVMYLHLDPLKK